MAVSPTARKSAASTMSSAQDTMEKGKSGQRNVDAVWLTERGRFARAIVADPDIVFYLAWLCSNRLRKMVKDAETLLEQMILGAEGQKFAQSDVPASASARFTASVGKLSQTVSGGSTDADLLARVTVEANTYVKTSLLPNIRTGTRLQVKGAEATSQYFTAKKELLKMWPTLLRLLSRCSGTSVASTGSVIAAALSAPTENLAALASSEWQADRASSHTLHLLAGVSSLTAMSTSLSLTSRPAWADFNAMSTGIRAVTVPSLAVLSKQIQDDEGPSAAEVRDLCSYLASVAVSLSALSTEVRTSLERQGSEYESPATTIDAFLLAYSPAFSSSTKKAAKASLDTMRGNKFDYAETLMLEASIDGVVQIQSASGASRSGRMASALSGAPAPVPSLPVLRER